MIRANVALLMATRRRVSFAIQGRKTLLEALLQVWEINVLCDPSMT